MHEVCVRGVEEVLHDVEERAFEDVVAEEGRVALVFEAREALRFGLGEE